MKPGIYDLHIEQGTDLVFTVTWQTKDDEGTLTAVDVSGYSARMNIKPYIGDEIKWTSEGADPEITIGTTDGNFSFNVSSAKTKTYNFNKGRYEMEVISPAGRIYRLLKGSVQLGRELIEEESS